MSEQPLEADPIEADPIESGPIEFSPIIYDACVLYPATLRDLLIELAVSRLFLAHWTDTIHDEWTRNLLERRTDLKSTQLERTRKLMDNAVPGSLIGGFEPIIPTLNLPDPNDQHVLAAAIHPDAFVTHWLETHPVKVTNAIQAARTRMRNPARTVDEHLERLASQGLPPPPRAVKKQARLRSADTPFNTPTAPPSRTPL